VNISYICEWLAYIISRSINISYGYMKIVKNFRFMSEARSHAPHRLNQSKRLNISLANPVKINLIFL